MELPASPSLRWKHPGFHRQELGGLETLMDRELVGLSQGLVWPRWNLPFGFVPGALRSSHANRVKHWHGVILGEVQSGLN